MSRTSWILVVLLWWATSTHLQTDATYRGLTFAAAVGMTWLLWNAGRE